MDYIEEWVYEKLGDLPILFIDSDRSKRYPKRSEFQDHGIAFLNAESISSGRFDRTKVNHISQEKFEEIKKGRVENGDVVLTMRGNGVGDAALIKGEGVLGLINAQMLILRPNDETINSNFLYYGFISPQFKRELSNFVSGSAQPQLTMTHLRHVPFCIPPLLEQKTIAHILSSLDDKIELNRQMNETLEAMAQALFKSWFVDFDPVIDNALAAGKSIPDELLERAKQRQSMLDGGKTNQAIRDLFPDEFEFTKAMGWIPRGWETTQLESLAVISSSKRIFAKEYQTEGVPFFRGKEISLLSKGESFTSDIFISKERFLELKNKFGAPVPGDLLLTSVGTIGNSYLVQEGDEFYFKDGNLTWFSNYKTEIKGGYLSIWFNTRQAYLAIEDIKIGSTQQAITISSLNGIKIVKPKDSVVSLFNKFSEGVISKVSKLRKERETLTKLRDTLLPKLLSGELRIPDAERLVDEAL
jgi:type I restriction enzyme S subunit